MSNFKGCINIYDELDDLTHNIGGFFKWYNNKSEFSEGMICYAPVWYEKDKRWYFVNNYYDPIKEEESNWKLKEFTGSYPKKEEYGSIQKHFKIEKDEYLITTHSKNRPVILLKKNKSDWFNPTNSSLHINTWLCIPIFSYKDRHNQNFVLNDLKWQSNDRVYMPPTYSNKPGMKEESCLILSNLQYINEKYLQKYKCLNSNPGKNINEPFGLERKYFDYVKYHIYLKTGLDGLVEPNDPLKEDYNNFIDNLSQTIEILMENS